MNRRLKFTLLLTICLSVCMCICAGASVDKKSMRAAKYGRIAVSGTKNNARRTRSGKKVDLSKYGLDGSLEYMHGMYYMARVKTALKAKAADKAGGKVAVKKGENVVCIYLPGRKGNAVCRLKNKRTVLIPGKYLTVSYYIYNSSSAYADIQVEEWVASHGVTSQSNYIFFASKYNQRGWILVWTEDGWRCKYNLKITTGAYTNNGYPNDCYSVNSCSLNAHTFYNKGFGQGISYASKSGGNQIHRSSNVLRPSTHGCIGMRAKDYVFVFWYLPYGTRVVLF